MTEAYRYVDTNEAIRLHVLLMRRVGETRFGVFDRSLVESALARPRHASSLSNADLNEQAATLLYGLIRSHPWVGGNKRTATLLTQVFLQKNRKRLIAETDDIVNLCLRVESRRISIRSIAKWFESRVEEIRNGE